MNSNPLLLTRRGQGLCTRRKITEYPLSFRTTSLVNLRWRLKVAVRIIRIMTLCCFSMGRSFVWRGCIELWSSWGISGLLVNLLLRRRGLLLSLLWLLLWSIGCLLLLAVLLSLHMLIEVCFQICLWVS